MRCSVFGCEVKAIVCLVKVTFIFLLKWRTIFLLRGEFDKQEVGVAGIFFFQRETMHKSLIQKHFKGMVVCLANLNMIYDKVYGSPFNIVRKFVQKVCPF